MATAKKTAKRATAKKKQLSPLEKIKAWLLAAGRRINACHKNFLARRPHRSFRLTRRRDYARSLTIPGYIAFTIYVNRTVRAHWKLFLPLALLYAFITIALGAIASQDVYATMSGLLSGAGEQLFDGGWSQLGQAGLIALSTFASSGSTISADQGIYLGLSLLFVWLATVWLLREILVGRKPKLRDGLYNSGAPILSTVGVLLVIVVQLLPVGIVMLIYAGLSAIGLIGGGFGAMLFWMFAAVVVALVLYWVTSTIIALVVVTIPGMYPLRAVRLAGDLVVGRRLRILLRLLWGAAATLISWALVLVGSVFIDNLVKTSFPDAADFSAVPYIVAIVSSLAIVWFAAYVYLFYRKVVDDDAKPA